MATLEEILSFAIDQEKKAARRYERLAEIVKDSGTRKILLDMKKMEEDHQQKLETLNINEFIQNGRKPVIDLHLTDDRDISNQLKDLSPEDVIVMAASYEEDARELYLSLAEVAPVNSSSRDLLLRLAEEEAGHKYELEKQLEKGIPAS